MLVDFDVFLSHNSRDKPLVEQIGERLRARGLRVWLDKWELRPGFPWQEGLEEAVQISRAVAVFVGAGGLGAWQEPEMRAFINRSRREKVPVIPVLLPGCPDSPQLTVFLEAFTWVDLRQGLTEDGLAYLVWGITGEKPGGTPTTGSERGRSSVLSSSKKTPNARWIWAAGLVLLTILLALAGGLFLQPPKKPEIYSVRVQVFDPQGRPVERSKVRTSAGNEPHLLSDGWWEIQIPAVKVPADGRVTLRADHKQWEGNSANLRLGLDPNPQVEIRLKPPETSIRGLVVDGHNRGLAGVRVSSQDGAPTTTDAEGWFVLKLSEPPETLVTLRIERKGSLPQDFNCYAGNDCPISLEDR